MLLVAKTPDGVSCYYDCHVERPEEVRMKHFLSAAMLSFARQARESESHGREIEGAVEVQVEVMRVTDSGTMESCRSASFRLLLNPGAPRLASQPEYFLAGTIDAEGLLKRRILDVLRVEAKPDSQLDWPDIIRLLENFVETAIKQRAKLTASLENANEKLKSRWCCPGLQDGDWKVVRDSENKIWFETRAFGSQMVFTTDTMQTCNTAYEVPPVVPATYRVKGGWGELLKRGE